MKKNKKLAKNIFAGALALSAASTAHAQYAPPPPPLPFQGFINEQLRAQNPYMNQWDFSGNDRFRFEAKHGFQIPGQTGSADFRKSGADMINDYFMNRLRFHVAYTDKWWSAYVEPQSSVVVSDERFAYANAPFVAGTVKRKKNGPESDIVDLHQAYFTVGNHKEFPVSIKAGRQELSYGEERLVGAFGWNNIGRSFDSVKLRWQNEFFGADFFTGYPVIPEDGKFDVDNTHDLFSGVYATSMKIPHNILDVYFLARNADRRAINAQPSPQFPQPTARDIYTVGGRIKSKPAEIGNWDYSLEGAYQFGDFATTAGGARLMQQAFMAVVQGGYTFADAWATPRLGFEYCYSSGDDNSADGKHGTFDNLFPTNHKFYGYMDFVSLQNIQDVRGEFQLKPTPRLSVALEGHGFWRASAHDFFYNVGGAPRTTGGYGINAGNGTFIGSELDLIAGYALTRNAQIEGGYGHFFTGSFVDKSVTGGSQDANYFYVQTSINF